MTRKSKLAAALAATLALLVPVGAATPAQAVRPASVSISDTDCSTVAATFGSVVCFDRVTGYGPLVRIYDDTGANISNFSFGGGFATYGSATSNAYAYWEFYTNPGQVYMSGPPSYQVYVNGNGSCGGISAICVTQAQWNTISWYSAIDGWEAAEIKN